MKKITILLDVIFLRFSHSNSFVSLTSFIFTGKKCCVDFVILLSHLGINVCMLYNHRPKYLCSSWDIYSVL